MIFRLVWSAKEVRSRKTRQDTQANNFIAIFDIKKMKIKILNGTRQKKKNPEEKM
jgi:hypothetical protein